jgi:hypothetical protein
VKRAVVLLSMLPAVAALVLVRPASAADPVYDRVGLTAVLAGVRTDGLVGASGGLVTLDSGSAYLVGRLDSSPSAHVLAAPYEPGTLARTGVGQVNGGAGSAVLVVPDAEASYPGAQTKGTCCVAPPVDQPPLTFGAAQATAEVGPALAKGTSTGAAYELAGVLSAGSSTSTLSMTTAAANGEVTQQARTAVSKVVTGPLTLSNVVATASITTDHDRHSPTQSLAIGGADVAGQAVQIGNAGVTAVGTPLIPGMTLEAATASANAQLSAAGITVHTVGGTTRHDARSATASSGGVRIDLASPDLPGGVAANSFTTVVGGIELTETDTLFVAPVATPLEQPVVPPAQPPVSTTTTTVIPGTPGVQGSVPVTPLVPAIASPQLVQTSYTVAGRRVSGRIAFVAFAGWQMLTLGSATLYAFVERRRRLILMERPA